MPASCRRIGPQLPKTRSAYRFPIQRYHALDGANHENRAKLVPLGPMQGADADRVLVGRYLSGLGVSKQIDRNACALQACNRERSIVPVSGDDADISGAVMLVFEKCGDFRGEKSTLGRFVRTTDGDGTAALAYAELRP